MQFKANDGSMHKSQKQAFDASQKPAAPAMGEGQPKSIEDDPKAMQLVDELKNMGYSADDVERAMGGDEGKEATEAAGLNIPSLQ